LVHDRIDVGELFRERSLAWIQLRRIADIGQTLNEAASTRLSIESIRHSRPLPR